MFRGVSSSLRRQAVGLSPRQAVGAIRFNSKLASEPQEIETKIADTSDPQRSPFFQYSWGSWLKNDKIEKAKRQTRFSIEGATKLVQDLLVQSQNPENLLESGDLKIKKPVTLNDNSVALTQNLDLVGSLKEGETQLLIKSIASIHEGKHHRVYKVTLSNGKELILRIPYKLESEHAIAQKIKSEVATIDFLKLKLGLKVPRVLSYGTDKVNFVQSPYILLEYIPGDLLMKQWEPLIADEIPDSQQKLLDVIKPIADFQNTVNSVVFNKFGSLYFTDDVEGVLQNDAAYDGETNPDLQNRWKIGPSVEKVFSKNKSRLSPAQISKHNGPWSTENPHELIVSAANIELENLRNRLGLAQADSSHSIENEDLLKQQITTFENLVKIAPSLLNDKANNIPNVEELFKPRLFLADLDPLNVIANSDRNGELTFVDFEYSTIKPFIYFNYPNFVSYSGVKIYNLEEDVPGFAELDELDKQQYQFMYYKTRNERLWEIELNQNRHDLIAVASPHIKVLRSPYIQALELKNDKDHLYVEGAIVQLQSVWDAYVANELCKVTEAEFPIAYSQDFVEELQAKLQEYQAEVTSTPFAATGGWIPQDMFEQLRENGLITPTLDGFKIETEKILEEEA